MNIAKASQISGVSPDTLRYYEKIGLVPSVERTKNGNRNYGEDDLKWIEFSKCMRTAGLSINVLTEYLRLFKEGDSTLENRYALLQEQRIELQQRIDQMQETLERLNQKIENYDTQLLKKEKALVNKQPRNSVIEF
ncbi:MerR family transcriptional regulator [Desemzia sp. RIT804]|uniref:MerR family transcriptional regulator n=1 Tax=Desemzia sp. RIT 804 TaxID=2810209 RepID=UPI001951EFCD|nr:MerR family transcriptional regulator [Desemzia sp. RIT 804]MBM6613535.1 MerR family transcriptional regulator [Desemzia sp. RIT 804]